MPILHDQLQYSHLNFVFKKFSNCGQWEVLGSICCHPDCPSEILHKIATGIATKKGYEYLERIIARNKNTKTSTLEFIRDNHYLEFRYRDIARITLEKGVKDANKTR